MRSLLGLSLWWSCSPSDEPSQESEYLLRAGHCAGDFYIHHLIIAQPCEEGIISI